MITHVRIVAVLFVIFGVFGILAAFFSSMFFGVLATLLGASGEEGAPFGVAVLGLAGMAISVVLLLFSIPALVAGWGLFKLRPWARILGIILAAISLTKIPVGTLFGVYALVVLFRKDTEELFVKKT